MQTGEDYKMPIILDPRDPNYDHNIRVLAAKNPKHPRVVEYRQLMMDDSQEMEAELQEFDLLDDDEQWAKEMVARAEAQEDEEEPLTNEEIERHFADGTGPFADD